MRAKSTLPDVRTAMEDVAARFFEKFGGSKTEVIEKQWREVMAWRAKRVAFAHPLLGDSLNQDSLAALEQTVASDGIYKPVQCAARTMIEAAKLLLH
ncbi:hypothetical protein GPECTOR_164g146 [Gonium pectorale]|uniref:Uncharacterized protein n=1 Tax=Gonium pectorale TaxID=33097 RepID=A0A150FXF3_GONPE|nr:hypothetical protein GPECTOR_164g146 [Gonium pectorale]|eukprot:KXZ42304.1 hypothetical protein GPECTOR_164g146 [Gonium pectorale]